MKAEIHEITSDDYCRECGGTGSTPEGYCRDCGGKGHRSRYIDRHFHDKGPSAVCVFDGKVIGYRARSGPSEECGCPEEDWVLHNMEATIHHEDDGGGHMIVDAGDWQHEEFVDAPVTFDQLRQHLFDYITGVPAE